MLGTVIVGGRGAQAQYWQLRARAPPAELEEPKGTRYMEWSVESIETRYPPSAYKRRGAMISVLPSTFSNLLWGASPAT